MRVFKFGGASVSNVERIKQVTEILKKEGDDELPARMEYASKADYQFQQAINLLKGLQIMQKN